MSRLDIGRRVDEHVRPDTPALQGFAFARCCGFSSASIPHALTGKVGSGSRRFRPHAVAYDLWLPPAGSIRDLHPPPFIHARRTQSPYGLLPIPSRSLSQATYSCVDPPPPSTLISRGEVSHRCWHRGKGGHVRIPSETAVSEAIVEVIETLREAIILNLEPAYDDLVDVDGLQFSLEAPRRRKKGIGRHAKPTDIRVYRLGSEILDLRIEAKCLVRASDIARSYLSKDGIERFSDPHEPYTDHEVGGMVAYTICGDRSYWLTKIDSALSARVPPIPTFKHRIHTSPDETLFCMVPYSPHNGRKSEVLVFHLVLEFNSDPPVR